jgi:hypothetical protein
LVRFVGREQSGWCASIQGRVGADRLLRTERATTKAFQVANESMAGFSKLSQSLIEQHAENTDMDEHW